MKPAVASSSNAIEIAAIVDPEMTDLGRRAAKRSVVDSTPSTLGDWSPTGTSDEVVVEGSNPPAGTSG